MNNLKVPQIDWKPFVKDDPKLYELSDNGSYLILIEEDNYDGHEMGVWDPNHLYHVDVANPWGSYIDDFWNTENDWDEGQQLKVLAYAELPYAVKVDKLTDIVVDKSVVEQMAEIPVFGKTKSIDSWHTHAGNIKLRNDNEIRQYSYTFETTNPDTAKRIEKFFQGLMDEKIPK